MGPSMGRQTPVGIKIHPDFRGGKVPRHLLEITEKMVEVPTVRDDLGERMSLKGQGLMRVMPVLRCLGVKVKNLEK